jgi:pyruvate kinase
MPTKNTKLVCTIGPASKDTATLIKMIKAGMNVARLNFSHGTHASQLEYIHNIRLAEKATGITVAIVQDLQGPKIRLGILPDKGVAVKKGEEFVLDTSKQKYSQRKEQKIIPVQYKSLHKDVTKGDLILIEDGMIKTKVKKVKGTSITVQAITPGIIKTHKGLNVPTASISADPLTKKDLIDLKVGIKAGIDYVALSFVRQADDIVRLRKILLRHKSRIQIIAKIERHEAMKNIKAIIAETDAVMVARGDLGVETPLQGVPIAQKAIVRYSGDMGKPVIVATEMLQSMIENPRATRAEISDAANAIFDHADALMLSNESATGKYPVQAVKTLSSVASSVEHFQKEHHWTKLKYFDLQETDSIELCQAATILADETEAKLIIALTDHGFTARHVSRQRTFQPIVVVTPYVKTRKELQLCWGIHNVIVSEVKSAPAIVELLKKEKLVKKGDKIVIVSNASTNNREIILREV